MPFSAKLLYCFPFWLLWLAAVLSVLVMKHPMCAVRIFSARFVGLLLFGKCCTALDSKWWGSSLCCPCLLSTSSVFSTERGCQEAAAFECWTKAALLIWGSVHGFGSARMLFGVISKVHMAASGVGCVLHGRPFCKAWCVHTTRQMIHCEA